MIRCASIGALLVLLTPLIGANGGDEFKSSRANEAANRYLKSLKQAAENFDKKVRPAREGFIRELKSAESIASRIGDDVDAYQIRKRYEKLSRTQELPTQLPIPLVLPATALTDARFLFNDGTTWHFRENGSVVVHPVDKTPLTGNWKPLGTHSVTARFSSFYAVAFDQEYSQCIIRSRSVEFRGKRVREIGGP